MTAPISVIQASIAHSSTVGALILNHVNELLVARMASPEGSITIAQEELAAYLEKQEIPETVALDDGWYAFEAAYRSVGWAVSYHPRTSPTRAAYWVFIPMRNI